MNVKTTNGIEQRLKIIRADNIGEYSWNNDGYRGDNWTKSALMEMLNGIYYDSQNGECWIGSGMFSVSQKKCQFDGTDSRTKGLEESARDMIDKNVIWNLGGKIESDFLVTQYYEYERGTNVYNGSPTTWNSSNTYTTSTEGESTLHPELFHSIGLMYPSDYGYATSGGTLGRTQCFSKILSMWDSNNYKTECANNDWLKPSADAYTLMSRVQTDGSVIVYDDGSIPNAVATSSAAVYPTVYLSDLVRITGGLGTSDQPYILTLG